MPADNAPYFLIVLITTTLSLGCLLAAFHFYRRRCLIDDTPTSKTKGVFIGLVELKGTAESEKPLASYLAGTRCVYYRYKIEEHWCRTSLDAKGRPTTESGWNTVAQETMSVPIFVKDDTGLIRVLSEGAEIHAENVFKQECRRDNPLYYDKGPQKAVGNSTHRRRFTEEAIPLHHPVYVVGQARERRDIVAAEIAGSKSTPLFLISTKDETHHSSRYRLWYTLWLTLSLAVTLGGLWLFHNQSLTPPPLGGLIAVGITMYALAVLLGWVWNAYNSLVHLRQRVSQGWSQIEVELKRRHDLIPNLLRITEAYQSHERSLQQLITDLRREAAETPSEATVLPHGMSLNLLATIEKYPELKADQAFLALQHALTEAEQRLALARDYYNEIATFYRTRLEVFPDRWLGQIAGFTPRPLLAIENFERAPVSVELAA